MSPYTSIALINVSIIIAIGVACWASGSGLPLFGLIFLMELQYPDQPNEIPKTDKPEAKP